MAATIEGLDYGAVDCLFPLLLKEWKDSWVRATNSPGELKCQVEAAWGDGYEDDEALVAAMDAAGVETALCTDLLAWSYRRQERFALDMTERIAELSRKYPGRFVGLASYDPLHIGQGLRKVRHDVEELGFRGVYVHIYGYDVPLDDRRMYPLYALCEELGVPVAMQVGHVLEAMPSEHGRPIQLDRIACDFPDLTIVGTHTGWPWVDEMIAVATKWPNVYINISAWLPRYMSPQLVRFMKSRMGAQKVLFGTNGLPWRRFIDDLRALDLREDTLRAILHDTPKRVYGL